VLVRNQDLSLSQPFRLLIATVGGYKLPIPAAEPWMIAQGPYGSFSHFNRTLHAWDIAPLSGRCVVAMRGGVAYTFDLGLRQTQRIRSFGNYITIKHDDGEYSHYGHLASGGFQVQNGQRVEQGQALAIVGNSGYTFGPGGGHHVHVQVTRDFPIISPSIPFLFDDLEVKGRRVTARTVTSTNSSPLCACRQRGLSGKPGPIEMTGTSTFKEWKARVTVGEWWTDLVTVSKGAAALEVKLSWEGDRDLDLHLTSPGGKHYGWYGITTGYSGQKTNPEEFRIADPEPGMWRVSVRGMRGGLEPIDFRVESSVSWGGVRVAKR
jgi:Peptidase family M23